MPHGKRHGAQRVPRGCRTARTRYVVRGHIRGRGVRDGHARRTLPADPPEIKRHVFIHAGCPAIKPTGIRWHEHPRHRTHRRSQSKASRHRSPCSCEKLHTSPASSSDYSLRVTVDSSDLLAYIRNCSTLKSQDLCTTEAPGVSAWGLFHMRVRAEAVGFEPTLALQHAKAAYQTAAIDLSAMPPKRTPHRQVKNA